MHELTTTVGIVALAGVALAVAALGGELVLARSVRRLREDQSAILGAGEPQDLVGHAAALGRYVDELSSFVERTASRLEERMGLAEQRLDGAVAYHALVRYDAYGEMSGRQSLSIALLDAHHSGVVLTAIHHRDQARLYAKQVHAGQAESALSPEEAEAVAQALASAPTAEARR